LLFLFSFLFGLYSGLVRTQNMFDQHAIECAPKLTHFFHLG
jgi:hypothetical protein